MLAELLVRSDKDPKDFIQVYDELVDYLNEDEHIEIMAEELKSRNVQCTNFYDICLDYILIDSFEVKFLQLLDMYLCTIVLHPSRDHSMSK